MDELERRLTMIRFWNKVNKQGPMSHQLSLGRCWVWMASKVPGRQYGTFMLNQKVHRSHRVSWAFAFGPIPVGMFVLHKCDNPSSVRPSHLFLGTQVENMSDASRKKRICHGSKHPCAKLTEENVIEIRKRYASGNITTRALGLHYSVGGGSISRIITRQIWRNI